jgi:hypothetical protein
MATRIERCYTDNIYLIETLPPDEDDPYKREFSIMGNSGRVYKVTVENRPKCTCPDFRTRNKRCKHIYFVLIRIMDIENYYESKYSDDELETMFNNIPEIAKELMYKGENLEDQKEVDQKFDEGDICPICLDPLENGKELDFCKYSCGKTIHLKCFNMWEKSKGGICVFCRAKWYSNIFVTKHRKVLMHPVGSPLNPEEKEEDKKEEEEKKEEKKEKKSEKKLAKKKAKKEDNTIEIEEESENEEIQEMSKSSSEEDDKTKRKKKKKRLVKKSEIINKEKNKKKYKYPKD